jgi:DNA-binding NtrC family response regulator
MAIQNQKSKPQDQKILIIDDDENIRDATFEILLEDGYQVETFDPLEPDVHLLRESYDVVILDLMMPDKDGFTLRKEIIKYSPNAQFIIITGFPDVDKLDEAMNLGVFTFLTKPFTADHIRYFVMGALRVKRVMQENLKYKSSTIAVEMGLIGKSLPIERLRQKIVELAPLDIPVLITGESGTGKEIVSRYIHQCSQRAKNQFTAVNCAGLSANLIESELFGHAQGAFTGATKTKYGFFEISDGGTLFLDEIADMPPELQSRLLRVLDKGEFNRVGETVTRQVNVRVISATNRDLADMVRSNKFRKDLYYRLRGAQIEVLPLRKRKEDIPSLVHYFIDDEKYAVTPDAMDLFIQFDWPGNVRELRMVVENLKGVSPNRIITKEAAEKIIKIGYNLSGDESSIPPYKDFKNTVVKSSEKRYFESVLQSAKGNISQAARLAGMDRKNLYEKLKQLEIPHNNRRNNAIK